MKLDIYIHRTFKDPESTTTYYTYQVEGQDRTEYLSQHNNRSCEWTLESDLVNTLLSMGRYDGYERGDFKVETHMDLHGVGK